MTFRRRTTLSNTYDIGVLNSSGTCCGAHWEHGRDDICAEHWLQDFELDRKRYAAAGEILSGDYEQLHECVRADLRGDVRRGLRSWAGAAGRRRA